MNTNEVPGQLAGRVLAASRRTCEAIAFPALTVDQFVRVISALDPDLVVGWERRQDRFALLLASEGVTEIEFEPGPEVGISRVDRGDSYIDANRYWSGEELFDWVWAGFLMERNLGHLPPSEMRARILAFFQDAE
jgi:hypothetical protein